MLLYRMESGGVMDMYHTEVPASQRGKGVGGHLAHVSLLTHYSIFCPSFFGVFLVAAKIKRQQKLSGSEN